MSTHRPSLACAARLLVISVTAVAVLTAQRPPGQRWPAPGNPFTTWQSWWDVHEREFAADCPPRLSARAADEIVRALRKTLAAADTARHPELQAACVWALARIGSEFDGVGPRHAFAQFLDAAPPLAAVAALALGLAPETDTAAFELQLEQLAAVATAEPPRAAVALGLGLSLRATADPDRRRRTVAALRAAIAEAAPGSDDTKIGAVLALGVLADASDPASRQLRAEAARSLTTAWDRPRSQQNERFQACCALAMARLLDPEEPNADAVRERFLVGLVEKGRPHPGPDLRAQSCTIALGYLVRPEGDLTELERRCRAELPYLSLEHADPMVRNFALLALARLGDADAARVLQHRHSKESKVGRQWTSLALALHQQPVVRRGERAASDLVAQLLGELETNRHPATLAAIATGLGMLDEPRGTARIQQLLRANLDQEDLAGPLARALARRPDPTSAAALEQAMADAGSRPELEVQLALAQAELSGDARALVHRLADPDRRTGGADRLTVLSRAIGRTRDARAVAPLIERLEDPAQPPAVRTAAAAALGGLADPRPRCWSTAITTGLNHEAAPPWLLGEPTSVLSLP